MRKKWPGVLLCVFLASCARPDVDLIGKDLGITIPQHYELLRGSSEPFGLGADADQTFVFKVDSAECPQLEKEIMNTPFYNCAGVAEFDRFPIEQKLKILRGLADHRLTSYWIKSGSTYWFDGDSLFLNTHDNIRGQLLPHNIVLPNSDSSTRNGPMVNNSPMFTVRARLDMRRMVLSYRYIHT